MSDPTSVRIDKWLWAVRLTKTRSAANDACTTGKVRVNDEPAKPATKVKVGDRIQARVGGRTRQVEVVRLIEKRVGAAIAAECLIEHTPERDEAQPVGPMPDDIPRRDRGAGRPTKRDRRQLERLRRDRQR